MEERRGVYRVLEVKPEGKRPLEDPGVEWRRILRWFFRYLNVKAWTESSWHRLGIVCCSCECSNEPSGSIKCGEFLTSWKPLSFSRRTVPWSNHALNTLLNCRFPSSNCGLLGFLTRRTLVVYRRFGVFRVERLGPSVTNLGRPSISQPPTQTNWRMRHP